ncbi:acyltransferase (plasmid) [Salipiger sp. H15]|uniref:Acyltransferase n=1 Tax=Alloyangia sp. H15 TaxID=3029062 RepID=A0AAU8AQX0_9RHOB
MVGSVLDPRAYLHMFKIVNYYNYIHVTPLRRVQRGRGVTISPTVWFAEPDRIRLGNAVHLNGGCMLWAGPSTGTITVGDNALFGPNVMVTAANYRFNDGQPVTEQEMDEQDVVIGRDVWLGTGVTVLPGAKIGDGCVVAAGSVVRGTFPPFSIIAGAPAKVVGQRTQPRAAKAADLKVIKDRPERAPARDERSAG